MTQAIKKVYSVTLVGPNGDVVWEGMVTAENEDTADTIARERHESELRGDYHFSDQSDDDPQRFLQYSNVIIMPAVAEASDIVFYDHKFWLVGETAIGQGRIARLWPRVIRTAKDGREYVAPHPDFFGRDGDIWVAAEKLEVTPYSE